METERIGWIGLGNMGIPMSMNLVKSGFQVNVYNRTRGKMETLIDVGAKASASIDELCKNSDVIFVMLSNDEAVESVFTELLKCDVHGKLFINMSTISPNLAISLSDRCYKEDASYLDAPVSGSVKPAMDATLLILVGGKDKDYDKATPLFEKLGKLSLLLGNAGAGSKAKLAINYYMSVIIGGLSETVSFAEQHGINKEAMMLIVNESACGSPMSKMKTPSIINNNYPAAFPLKYMLKDIKLAMDEGLNSELSPAILRMYQKASDMQLGDDDLMAVIKTTKK